MTEWSKWGGIVATVFLGAIAGAHARGAAPPAPGVSQADVRQPAVLPPAVGEPARDFTLSRLDGTNVTLSRLWKSGPVVVLMLRGWVGYQ